MSSERVTSKTTEVSCNISRITTSANYVKTNEIVRVTENDQSKCFLEKQIGCEGKNNGGNIELKYVDYKSSCNDNRKCNSKKKKRTCIIIRYVCGFLLIALSISGFIYTPLDIILWEKINMRPGLPSYSFWLYPPDIQMKIYVFNVTNHERFLSGLDKKINLQEIGPISYLIKLPETQKTGFYVEKHFVSYNSTIDTNKTERLVHSNVRRNENSTLTYTAKRELIYLPEKNNINLNDTLVVPNMALLGLASYLHNAPKYFVSLPFRILASSTGSMFFHKRTIHQYLWDYTDPLINLAKNIAPGLVPVNNMGQLSRIYNDFTDEVTVNIGSEYGHKHFFQIQRFRGEPQLPRYDPNTCPDRIFGATEGLMYSQHLTHDDVLLYWRKTVCKVMPLYFDSEMYMHGIPAYRYNLSEDAFTRITNGTDCYDAVPSLPSGVSDVSRCYYGFPLVMSYPHFYTGQPEKDSFVTGLRPDRNKHNSYVILEPISGTPLRSVARMQCNLQIHDLSKFSSVYDKFSNLILPSFWIEYNLEDLPEKIMYTLYFLIVILPPLSSVICSVLLILGSFLMIEQLDIYVKFKRRFDSFLKFKSKQVDKFVVIKKEMYENETLSNELGDFNSL